MMQMISPARSKEALNLSLLIKREHPNQQAGTSTNLKVPLRDSDKLPESKGTDNQELLIVREVKETQIETGIKLDKEIKENP